MIQRLRNRSNAGKSGMLKASANINVTSRWPPSTGNERIEYAAIERSWEIYMRAFVAVVLSVTAIAATAAANSASAADLRYAPRPHHVRYAPEPCSPCQVGWRFSPPLEYVGYWLGSPWVEPYRYRYHRWAAGCSVAPLAPCHRAWRERGLIRYAAPAGRYQLVQQKEYVREPVLVVETVRYVDDPPRVIERVHVVDEPCTWRCGWTHWR
jgi:hypothetical protein